MNMNACRLSSYLVVNGRSYRLTRRSDGLLARLSTAVVHSGGSTPLLISVRRGFCLLECRVVIIVRHISLFAFALPVQVAHEADDTAAGDREEGKHYQEGLRCVPRPVHVLVVLSMSCCVPGVAPASWMIRLQQRIVKPFLFRPKHPATM